MDSFRIIISKTQEAISDSKNMTTVLPCSAFLLLTVLCSSRLCVLASPDVTGDGVPIKQIGTVKG